jgi:predicted dithiol-disulfide oxidoreductase (DUF899 family)
VVIARSPVERLVAFKNERGWRNLRLYSDLTGEYSRDYYALSSEGSDDAALNVFTRSTEPSAISGAARWVSKPRTPGKIRAARRT